MNLNMPQEKADSIEITPASNYARNINEETQSQDYKLFKAQLEGPSTGSYWGHN